MNNCCRILPIFILFGVMCSCSQKESTSPTATPVTAITLNPTSITLTEGESDVINATISPSNASNKKVIWSSSDASVASVSEGKVTGIAKGTAIITAIADDNGKSANCTVIVNDKSGSGGSGGNGGNSGTETKVETVDLGLSVKWANMN